MKNMFKLFMYLLFSSILTSYAQVKISDTGSTSPGANSLLELESTTKGLLPPRVAINSLTAVAPLTGTVPAGMLVYSSGGTVTDGYYTWNGSKWLPFATGVGSVNVVVKSATGAIAKTETFIAASGDITLTLPAVTSADDGLAITIKNIGIHTDLVSVVGNGGATIDGISAENLYRWKSLTFIAYGTNWLTKERNLSMNNVFEVGPSASWTTITEILEYLGVHMTTPSTVMLDGGTYDITTTQTIDLTYPLTIQGPSYGQATIAAASGLTQGTPLFSCISEVSFKMIAFDATTLSGYGTHSGEDALQLVTAQQYHEIKDCTFDRFYSAIHATENVDIWLFESDINNSVYSGVEIAAGTSKYVSFFTSESDFADCAKAIYLNSGDSASVSIQNCTFTCATGQVGLDYNPTNFTHTVSLFFTNNTWNNVGTFINTSTGFDFTRTDGRDANAEIINNAGISNKNPHCKMNVINNASATTITTAGTYYKAVWTNTSSYTVNWKVENNKITYLPTNKKDVVIFISGNVTCNQAGRTVSTGIRKNGSGSIYGEITVQFPTTLLGVTTTVFPFSTVVYLQDVAKNDYFELFATSSTNGDQLTFSDVNIYVTSQ